MSEPYLHPWQDEEADEWGPYRFTDERCPMCRHKWSKHPAESCLAEVDAVWFLGLLAEVERLERAVQAVRDLPVWASVTTTEADVMVVRKADLDAALDGES